MGIPKQAQPGQSVPPLTERMMVSMRLHCVARNLLSLMQTHSLMKALCYFFRMVQHGVVVFGNSLLFGLVRLLYLYVDTGMKFNILV